MRTAVKLRICLITLIAIAKWDGAVVGSATLYTTRRSRKARFSKVMYYWDFG